ncbi:MAG: TIGR02186 family protein [Hyphomicrobiaceae bacterium]
MPVDHARLSRSRVGLFGLAALLACLLFSSEPGAQQKRGRAPAPPAASAQQPGAPAAAAVPAGELPAETVQADVSTRSVAVTSSFTGTEIVVFGAVDNSRQTSAEAGLYDVVIILEGTPGQIVVRRKANIAGIWMNTQSLTFVSVPSYYAIASTRPLDEIAPTNVLNENDIGFNHVRMTPVEGWETGLTTADLQEFKNAVIRLKARDGLYIRSDYDVVFIGRSLFRASIELPANVPVGALNAKVYLLRDGQLLSTYTSRVMLAREGLERVLHDFAFKQPMFYGIFTVTVAVFAGLAASTLLARARQ